MIAAKTIVNTKSVTGLQLVSFGRGREACIFSKRHRLEFKRKNAEQNRMLGVCDRLNLCGFEFAIFEFAIFEFAIFEFAIKRTSARLVEESNQFLAAAWLLQLANCFGFDLTDTFTGNFKNMANFFQSIAVTVT